jgi:hypothetical protein
VSSGHPYDRVTPNEQAILRLRQGPTPEELPLRMQCPSGHQARRVLLPEAQITIPIYVCAACTVVYRFQECTLVPGEEGWPE